MRPIVPCLLFGILVGVGASADSPADRISALYQAVPFERVRASPEVDILAHIDGMRLRREPTERVFAEPDVDIGALLREAEPNDALMKPGVLEAIARMPADRAALVLRMIEDRRAGLDPLRDVPSLSAPGRETSAAGPSLQGWRLDRDDAGAPFLQYGEDRGSRIGIVQDMVVANFGRVLELQDDSEGFRVKLESGHVLVGEIRQAEPSPAEGGAAGPDGVRSLPAFYAPEITDKVRPVLRPASVEVRPADPERRSGPPAASPRPKARPDMLPGTD